MEERWATARFAAFGALGTQELLALGSLVGPTQELRRGQIIYREGDDSPQVYLLHSGWTASSIKVANGTRQIVKVHMPGDVLGIPNLALMKSCDTLSVLSPAIVSAVKRRRIGQLFEESPQLAAFLFLVSLEERVMLMDRLALVGRAHATARIAQLMLQLHARVLRNKPDAGDAFYAPLSQNEIGDLTGLSSVHVSRTLGLLRRKGVATWSDGIIAIIDANELRRLAEIAGRELAKDRSWLPARAADMT